MMANVKFYSVYVVHVWIYFDQIATLFFVNGEYSSTVKFLLDSFGPFLLIDFKAILAGKKG